jgi:glucose/mannose-6-phosphate isomerase
MPMDKINELVERYDSHKMLEMLISFPDQLEKGSSLVIDVNLAGMESETFTSVVLAGMGGSAISGDLLKSLLISDIQIPFIVQRYYRLPRFVNRKTLVICSSYSGNTEETLSAFDDALESGAHIISITTGGKLSARSTSNKIPVIALPEGLPPRAALGYSFSVLSSVFSRLGICESIADETKAAAVSMRKRNDIYEPDNGDNPAISLARKLKDRIPLVYGGQDRLDAVAARFKGQLCENSKALAFFNQVPEFNHNEIVGLSALGETANNFVAVFLRDIDDHKRVSMRFDILGEYLDRKGIEVIELSTEQAPSVSRVFLMIQLIDYCSYYLALLNGFDPYAIEAINYLKSKLT